MKFSSRRQSQASRKFVELRLELHKGRMEAIAFQPSCSSPLLLLTAVWVSGEEGCLLIKGLRPKPKDSQLGLGILRGLKVLAGQGNSPNNATDQPEQRDSQNDADVFLGIYGKILHITPHRDDIRKDSS